MVHNNWIRRLILFCMLLLPMAGSACAGTICGTVRDGSTSAPVAEAGVFLRHPAGDYTGLSGVTDASGWYCVGSVPAGTYDLEVRHDEYLVAYRRNVTVADDATGVDLVVDTRTMLHAPYPNPVDGEVTLSFRLTTQGPARLAVYDMRGRLVQGWGAASLEAGEHAQRWSLLDRAGRRLAPGVYVVRLTAGAVVQTRMLVYLPR